MNREMVRGTHVLLEGRYNVTPDLSQVYFAVLWEQGSEGTLFEERFPLLAILLLQERFDSPMIDIVRVPSYSRDISRQS